MIAILYIVLETWAWPSMTQPIFQTFQHNVFTVDESVPLHTLQNSSIQVQIGPGPGRVCSVIVKLESICSTRSMPECHVGHVCTR